ncbi:Signal peptidase IB [Sutcliffiella rhizosphaerae]|uniref:Signal peptidase I n=2 Tax=Sutcliffiella rhizosphaerae TaxID=2880967 RepID=A0ABM8YSK4_9BACI|nr:Signal peptidase IB [Sutcliffiella rhizosphaerae]
MTTKMKNKNETYELIKALIIGGILVVLVRFFLFSPIVVDGESMVPTLLDEDRMIVNKLRIGEYDRFDIVVFHASQRKDFIKRIIGLPGDRIEYKNDKLYINGEFFEEPYLEELKKESLDFITGTFQLEETPGGYLEVPKGHVFVLGDNRKFSNDSRHIGVIPIDEIVGKAQIVYWPFERLLIVNNK